MLEMGLYSKLRGSQSAFLRILLSLNHSSAARPAAEARAGRPCMLPAMMLHYFKDAVHCACGALFVG